MLEPATKNKRHQKNLEEIIYNGKLPPQALDLEEAVLGAAMLEKNAPDKVMEVINTEVFYSDSNKLIWTAIVTLHRESKPIDILTVTEQLRKMDLLDMAGGAFYVTQLTNRVASAANIEYHAHIIYQKYMQRQMIHFSGEIGKAAFEDTTDAFELRDSAITMFHGLLKTAAKIESFGDLAKRNYKLMLEAKVSDSELLGIPSRHKAVNDFTRGYSPGVYVVAGRPGEGKSAFCLEEAYNAATNGIPSAYLCAEMSTIELCNRIFSNVAEESSQEIRFAKNLGEDKWDIIIDFTKRADQIPLYIIDIVGYNINQVCALFKELKIKYNIELGVLDYLQLINGDPTERYGNDELRLNAMTKRIKILQRELNLVLFELSQLTRLEKGVKRLYQTSDLKGSGGIEADADVVIFIYHPWMHGVKEIPEQDGTIRFYRKGEVLIIFAKFRNNPTGKINLVFKGEWSKFTDEEDVSIANLYKGAEVKDYTVSTRESEEVTNDTVDDLPF